MCHRKCLATGYHLSRCLVCIEPLAVRAHEDQGVLIQRLLLAVCLEQLVKEGGFLDPEGHSASILHEVKHLADQFSKAKVCIPPIKSSKGAHHATQCCRDLGTHWPEQSAALISPRHWQLWRPILSKLIVIQTDLMNDSQCQVLHILLDLGLHVLLWGLCGFLIGHPV